MSERTEQCDQADFAAFGDRLGLMTEENGLSRTAGRIFGLLLVSGEPLSFSEIASRLAISRGGVSGNTRLLLEMGLIDKVSRQGQRQDYFEIPANVWQQQIGRQMRRDRKALAHVEEVLGCSPELPLPATRRLSTLAAVLKRSVALCEETLVMLDKGIL